MRKTQVWSYKSSSFLTCFLQTFPLIYYIIPCCLQYSNIKTAPPAIAPNAFKGNKKIKSVKMGANVKTIGNNAFMNCTALTTVSMGKGVTTVGNSAFAGCKKLTKLTIGASVTKIGNNAFKGCVALTKVTIPKKVTTIGTQAFGGCKKLALVTIKAENLKKVGAKAFKSIKAGAKFKCGAKAEAYEKLLKKSGLPSKGKVIK